MDLAYSTVGKIECPYPQIQLTGGDSMHFLVLIGVFRYILRAVSTLKHFVSVQSENLHTCTTTSEFCNTEQYPL